MQEEYSDLRIRLGQATKAAIITIVQNNAENASKWKEDKSVLNQGHWYPADYINALLHWKMERRIALFKEKRFYEFGYANSDVFD